MFIFDRTKNCFIEEVGENKVTIVSSMSDVFHEIWIIITVELPEGRIIEARAEFKRMPDKICEQTAAKMNNLLGHILGKGIVKVANECIGGQSGCVHLVDLVIEAARALVQGKNIIRFRGESDQEKAMSIISRENAGTCHFHTNNAI